MAGSIYCFTERYCYKCREEIEKYPHAFEDRNFSEAKRVYVAGLSGTTYAINDTSVDV